MAMSTDLRLHFNPQGAVRRAALDCEADVFFEHYGNTRDELEAEYGDYDSDSVFVAVTDRDNVALAAARLIAPGRSGLKTIHDVARAPWGVDGLRSARAAGLDLATTWDVATIGVRRGVRGGMLLSAALHHAVIRCSMVNDLSSIVMIVDERARRVFTAVGLFIHPLPGTKPAPYLGSTTSTPMWGNRDAMLDGQRRTNPDAYRLIALGIGLDGISVPPTEDFHVDGQPWGAVDLDRHAQLLSA